MNRNKRRSHQAETRKGPPGSMNPEFRDMMQNALALLRDGRIDQAIAAYDAVLAREPSYPDALQYMGVAKMQSGQTEEAVDLLRRAVVAQPKNSQAHYNLGLALRETGRDAKALAAFRRAIAAAPANFEAHTAFAGMLMETFSKFDTAEAHLRSALKANPNYGPARNNLALLLDARGRLEDAATEAHEAARLSPSHAPTLITLGSILLKLGNAEEAARVLRDAVRLSPEDSNARANLGVALKFVGAPSDAEAELKRALELDPENFKSVNGLALLYSDGGRLEEAESLLVRAVSLKPDDAALHANLGLIYRRREKWGESITSYRRALDLDGANLKRAQEFVDSLSGAHFLQANHQLWTDLERGLEIDGINHDSLSAPAARMFRNSHQVATLIDAVSRGDFELSAMDVQKGEALAPLTTPFANLLLRRFVIPDVMLEELFANIRRSLLNLAVNGRLPEKMKKQTLDFVCALAWQCYLNEYVYSESAEESDEAASLQQQIDERLQQPAERPPRAAVAVLACYRSLDELATREILQADGLATRDDAFGRLITQQIRNPSAERVLMKSLSELGGSIDTTSKKVRQQYEVNPYPRWISVSQPKPTPLRALLSDLFPHADLSRLRLSAEPELLVAGCGTGAHAIDATLRYRNAHVLAIDLSRASLAYGKRQAEALGIEGITWAHGDILALSKDTRRYDMIDCAGVLHHMHDPIAGWRILRNKLKPGGVMKVGLYSKLARSQFDRFGRDSEPTDITVERIRAYRQEIIALPKDAPLKRLLTLHDFYTLSECRDLLFHVEEHRFTLPEIARCLDELELEFIGFEIRERAEIDRYRARFIDDPGAARLDNWHKFETENPGIFVAMYQFWAQPRHGPVV